MSVLSSLSANDKAPEALNLFSVPPNQVAVQGHYYEDLRPVSQFQQTPLEFETNLQGDTYTDLSKSKLFLKVRILKADGSRLDETVKVSPVNLFFHALFKQVDVYLNRTLVSSSGDTYALKAYLKTLFNSTGDEKSTILQGQLFYRDTAGFMAETSPNSGKLLIYYSNTWIFLTRAISNQGEQYYQELSAIIIVTVIVIIIIINIVSHHKNNYQILL